MDDEPSTVAAPDPPPAAPEWIRNGWPLVARCVRRLVHDDAWHDVAQDALLEAWRRRDSFDPTRGRADSWMVAIAVTHVRRFHQRQRSEQAVRLEDEHEPAQRDHSSGIAGRHDLLLAIDRLPERQQLAVTLTYFVDLPESEVAAVMGCRPGTVKSTLAAARAALQHHLGADYR